MQAVILARVSTKEQEDGHSLDAQLMRLREYCERKELTSIKEFTLVESSTRGKRPEFHEMIKFVKSQKETTAIIVDAVDRLQRGFKESPVLDELINAGKIELHFLRENMAFTQNSKNSEKMFWDMSILMAKSYVGSLSDNVKRSNEKKLKEGTICGSAPLGYINTIDINGNRTVTLDPARAFHVKKMFDDYATGLYSVKQVANIATKNGLRSKKGNILGNSATESILKNPFYYGAMIVKGRLYPHVYNKLISEYTFTQCKKVRESKKAGYSKSTKTEFIFKGLIKCKACGCSLSPEIKKGKYIYLRPNDKKGCGCKQINDKIALKAVSDALASLSIPSNELDAIKDTIARSLESKIEYSKTAIEGLRKQYDSLEIQQDKLLDLLLNSSITQDIFDKKIIDLRTQQHNVKLSLDKHTTANHNFSTTLEYLIKLASRAKDIFESSGIEQKRRIINLVFSNLYLEGENVTFSMRKPFNIMLNGSQKNKWLRRQGSNL